MLKKTVILLIALLLAASLTACNTTSDQVSLADFQTQIYTHPSGYEINMPKDWNVFQQGINSVIIYNADKTISLNIVSEIGGMDYHTMPELLQTATTMLAESIDDLSVVAELSDADVSTEAGTTSEGKITAKKTGHEVLKGMTKDGDQVLADVTAQAPLDGIHYYLIFLCGGKDYTANSQLFEDINKSFELVKTEDEIYGMLDDKMEFGQDDADSTSDQAEPEQESQ